MSVRSPDETEIVGLVRTDFALPRIHSGFPQCSPILNKRILARQDDRDVGDPH
jgi:hypothetical protein